MATTHHDTAGTDRQDPPAGRRLIPLTDWPKYHPWPTVAGLRHLRFNCQKNGFDRAFRTVGKRVLVDEREFFVVVDRQQTEASPK